MRVWPGSPHPLGATWDGEGVNFAVFSEHATAVELCLFDRPDAAKESFRLRLPERTHRVWHAHLADVRPGQLYGFRVHGPWAPEQGQRFNPHKLLLDPYAKALSGPVRWHPDQAGHRQDDASGALAPSALQPSALQPSETDSAAVVPKCMVVDTSFSWGEDRPPRTPWSKTVIYECHVKGLTARHPDVPEPLRGTYLGLASDAVLDHLLSLGVTSVELLPIHQHALDEALVRRGLANYWGYNSIGFFAPDPRFASGALGQQVTEFKSMVKALHRAGLEVILDVVYNHSGEGGELGPTLCFRGLDNACYYRHRPDDPSRYEDFSGCGNSLDARHPRVLQMILDSLRYWVTEMHVDGFRFDLAPVLGRDPHAFDGVSRFFITVQQDPVLAEVKLIAEPWDVGAGGYQVGRFPAGWTEWNARYRDAVRRFWRGDEAQVPELASRIAGSSDLFQWNDRGPHASVNYVACHDGFTLRDLVSYEHKHNEANGEDGQDGGNDNWSRNWGVEGEAQQVSVLRLRERMVRNLLATLAFSQGVPMLGHGDELGRTQRGNNNAYCHDSELAWLDWSLDEHSRALLEFTRRVFAIRHANPVFRRRRFFAGGPVAANGAKDVSWIRADGHEMELPDWHDPRNRVLGMLIDGQASDEVDERGRLNRGETLLLLLNAGGRSARFELPAQPGAGLWRELVNTAHPGMRWVRRELVNLAAHSVLLLAWSPSE